MSRRFVSPKLGALGAVVAAVAALPAAAGVRAATTEPAEPAFCAPYQAATQQFSSDSPDPSVVGPALEAMAANVPAEIADAAGVVIDTATKAAAGDLSVFDATPDFFPSLGVIDAWAFDHCSFDARVDVVATEYAFGGIPDEVPAGHDAFRLNNQGEEVHEIVLLRRLDGTTESWEDLASMLDVHDETVMSKVEVVGDAFSPNADTPGVVVADLEPGDYAAVCFVPVGSMQSDGEGGEATAGTDAGGPDTTSVDPADAHFMHGMLQEFTVV